MSSIVSTTLPVRSISEGERDRMYSLMEADYLGIDRSSFERDLHEKSEVMILREGGAGLIVGFSTLMVSHLQAGDHPVKVIFSGDTIVKSEYRHTPGLGVELGKYFRFILKRFPETPVFWILTSKGCRTYCLLPLLFREFFPRWDAPTPPLPAEVMDLFGVRKHPGEYDPATRVIHHRGSSQRLRPGVADADERRLRNPHVRFFVQANPDHLKGDDLVCVAEVNEENFSRRFLRMLEQ